MMKKAVRAAASLMLAAALLMCGGCGFRFDTAILSDTDSPDTVLANFFDALKSGNYGQCRDYLADNETFLVTDSTGYGFVNTLTDTAMHYLDYAEIGGCDIDSLRASRRISVTALNMDGLAACIKENFTSLEYDYLTEHDKRGLDRENDKEDIGRIMNIAIEKYADTVGTVSQDVTVNFVFTDGGWKIKLDSALIAAIFGDDINAQE